ncbi:hypothetical protein SAMN04487950_0248 [Halogranum rubrum]|uniref:Uncharacterized protein n=2 Tax=Halogranum rubrum TaxID=553466 RepID=A0A1I4B1Q8_9EURY|nr:MULTISPECIES: hypothetical protein [Halogranum]EJN58162.1 hypothetical protein HSB1_35790 [Halogranum salarium B-1]SFK62715.1 hypothetical protein SAMN04487950_0248 [Halogranum rubrum]
MKRHRVTRHDTAQPYDSRPAPPFHVSLALTLVAPAVVFVVAYPLLSVLLAVVAAVAVVGVRRE